MSSRLGPVFDTEMKISSRRWQVYAGRALFVVALLIGMLLAIPTHGPEAVSQTADTTMIERGVAFRARSQGPGFRCTIALTRWAGGPPPRCLPRRQSPL